MEMGNRRSVQMRISSARRRVRESGGGKKGRASAGSGIPVKRTAETGYSNGAGAECGPAAAAPPGNAVDAAGGPTPRAEGRRWLRGGRKPGGHLWRAGTKKVEDVRRANEGPHGETDGGKKGNSIAARAGLERPAKDDGSTRAVPAPGNHGGGRELAAGMRRARGSRVRRSWTRRGAFSEPRQERGQGAELTDYLPEGKGKSAAGKRKSRRGVLTLLLAALLASMGLMLWVYMYTDVLDVRSVTVEGNRRLSSSYLVSLSGIGEDTHLLRMDTGEVERSILSEPYVAAVRVRRKFPYTVVLEVEEREPLGVIPQNGKYHLVDAQGVVVESVGDSPGVLVEIRYPTAQVLYPGVRLEEREFFSLVTLLQAVPSSLKEVTTAAGYASEAGLYLECWGTKVIFGSTEDMSRKVMIMELALPQLSRKYGKIDYIDVSLPDRPVFRPAGA